MASLPNMVLPQFKLRLLTFLLLSFCFSCENVEKQRSNPEIVTNAEKSPSASATDSSNSSSLFQIDYLDDLYIENGPVGSTTSPMPDLNELMTKKITGGKQKKLVFQFYYDDAVRGLTLHSFPSKEKNQDFDKYPGNQRLKSTNNQYCDVRGKSFMLPSLQLTKSDFSTLENYIGQATDAYIVFRPTILGEKVVYSMYSQATPPTKIAPDTVRKSTKANALYFLNLKRIPDMDLNPSPPRNAD